LPIPLTLRKNFVMNISFSEIVDISKIQELHDSIYETFGLLTAILDLMEPYLFPQDGKQFVRSFIANILKVPHVAGRVISLLPNLWGKTKNTKVINVSTA